MLGNCPWHPNGSHIERTNSKIIALIRIAEKTRPGLKIKNYLVLRLCLGGSKIAWIKVSYSIKWAGGGMGASRRIRGHLLPLNRVTMTFFQEARPQWIRNMALDLESHPTLREAPGPNKASLQFGADEDNQGRWPKSTFDNWSHIFFWPRRNRGNRIKGGHELGTCCGWICGRQHMVFGEEEEG